ncbi:MAG: hypothetical protein ACYCS1_03790 [Gammaproteobacteria bacterium]
MRDGFHLSICGFRNRRWARGLVWLALVASVGLYALDSGHRHHTEMARLLCPVCHVVAHSSIEVFSPRVDSFQPIYSFLVRRTAVRKARPTARIFLALISEPRAPPPKAP